MIKSSISSHKLIIQQGKCSFFIYYCGNYLFLLAQGEGRNLINMNFQG